jgi:hypothetical protein
MTVPVVEERVLVDTNTTLRKPLLKPHTPLLLVTAVMVEVRTQKEVMVQTVALVL